MSARKSDSALSRAESGGQRSPRRALPMRPSAASSNAESRKSESHALLSPPAARPQAPAISVSPAQNETVQQQFDAKARWTAAVARMSEMMDPETMDDLTAYVYELQSELASNLQLVEAMLTAQDQLGSEAQTQLRQLADVAAERIISAENAQQTWRRRAQKMRNSAESLRCVICLERARNVVLKPCSHLALCSQCTALAVNTATCPLCRVPSTGVDVVFIP